MTRHRSTLLALSMSLVVASLVASSTAAQTLRPGQREERSPESLRAALLTSVAIETEGAFLMDPSGEFVKIEGPEDLESFVGNLGHGLPQVLRTRVFAAGRLVSEGESSALSIDRQEGIYNRNTGSLFVVGGLGNHVTIEDLRTLEDSGKVFILRDIYLDGEVADLRVGRSLPVRLESTGAKVSSTPQVSSLSGVTSSAAGVSNGRVAMGSCGGTYDGGMALNDQPGIYPWTINGTNFGSSTGQVAFAGQTVPTRSPWTSTKIIAEPTIAAGFSPATALLKVTTASGTSTSYGVSFVPAIRSRVYGQCTWFVALTRLQMGLQPSPTAYGGYSSITAQWVPKPGDQLAWLGKHTAIITAVSVTIEAGGVKAYTLTIKQYNADCHNSPGTYSAYFKVRTLNGQTSVTQYPQSSVSALGLAYVYYR
ncbi:MAG: hypothetical protein ACJ76Y_32060 [Thermoanaerobaculia bacterium]